MLLKAMRIVIDERPKVRCSVAGDGPLHQELQVLSEELGVDHAVSLLGRRSDVGDLLNAADIYVSSSTSEGLPLAILEAMAAGLPIVATKVGDIPEVVPNDAGILVEPGSATELASALLAMVDDPPRRHRCGQAAFQYVVNHHNPDRWAEQLAAIYKDISGANTAGSGRSVAGR